MPTFPPFPAVDTTGDKVSGMTPSPLCSSAIFWPTEGILTFMMGSQAKVDAAPKSLRFFFFSGASTTVASESGIFSVAEASFLTGEADRRLLLLTVLDASASGALAFLLAADFSTFFEVLAKTSESDSDAGSAVVAAFRDCFLGAGASLSDSSTGLA